MTPHIKLLSEEYDITLVTNAEAEDLSDLLGNHVSFIPLRIERKISLISDFVALIKLWRILEKAQFDCVHSIMPKSGLLAMLAANLARVPIRIHTFTGQVWANKHGFKRRFLKLFDKILSANATHILADSHSQREFLLANDVVDTARIQVLADGSIAGVDISRFRYIADARQMLRQSHRIPAEAIVFLFLGRVNRDKGILDLIRAFEIVAKDNSDIHLMIVGPDEDSLDIEIDEVMNRLPGKLHREGYTDCPEEFMSTADVFCLPSYREGFGSVIIEAAAVGIPSVASRIYGITDAVQDGVTGILHTPKSISEISSAIMQLATDNGHRLKMGKAAQQRVIKDFSEQRVAQALLEFYREILPTTENSTVPRLNQV
jgi:glycosyltransferase involved in cell wall biosynthesis